MAADFSFILFLVDLFNLVLPHRRKDILDPLPGATAFKFERCFFQKSHCQAPYRPGHNFFRRHAAVDQAAHRIHLFKAFFYVAKHIFFRIGKQLDQQTA